MDHHKEQLLLQRISEDNIDLEQLRELVNNIPFEERGLGVAGLFTHKGQRFVMPLPASDKVKGLAEKHEVAFTPNESIYASLKSVTYGTVGGGVSFEKDDGDPMKAFMREFFEEIASLLREYGANPSEFEALKNIFSEFSIELITTAEFSGFVVFQWLEEQIGQRIKRIVREVYEVAAVHVELTEEQFNFLSKYGFVALESITNLDLLRSYVRTQPFQGTQHASFQILMQEQMEASV